MAAPPGNEGASQHGRGQDQRPSHKPSKRRYTVHSSSNAPSAFPAPWPQLAVHYPPPQSILVPLYSPFWPLTPSTNVQPAGLLPAGMPLASPVMPASQGPTRAPATSRPSSPQRRGRARARSPDQPPPSHPEREAGTGTRSNTIRPERVSAVSPSGQARKPRSEVEPFPPGPSKRPSHITRVRSRRRHDNVLGNSPRVPPRRRHMSRWLTRHARSDPSRAASCPYYGPRPSGASSRREWRSPADGCRMRWVVTPWTSLRRESSRIYNRMRRRS